MHLYRPPPITYIYLTVHLLCLLMVHIVLLGSKNQILCKFRIPIDCMDTVTKCPYLLFWDGLLVFQSKDWFLLVCLRLAVPCLLLVLAYICLDCTIYPVLAYVLVPLL